ncbi:MAG: Trk system potassium transporter TrkA [Christensenellaceae bacterium]|nr:Trk system potassium transporter TrkA [Christensenellaceae bacterium]
MNIIIIGAGGVGRELVDRLAGEGHDITIIDNDKKALSSTIETYDVKGVFGNGAGAAIQQEAGIKNADLLVSCTNQDEVNILCGLVGKKLGVKDTIARVRNPEYSNLFAGNELGLSFMVNPEQTVAKEIARILKYPRTIKIEPFFDGKINIVELKITNQSPLSNIALKDIFNQLQVKLLVCCVQRGEEITIPSGSFILKPDDKVYITAPEQNMIQFLKISKMSKPAKTVLILGAGRITYYLIKELSKSSRIKVVEISEEKCVKLQESTSKNIDIICDDGTNHNVLLEEGLETVDAFVSLATRDEQNILVSLFANTKSVKKIITKIDDASYIPILEASGIESIISTRITTANEIVRYVREKENAFGSSVKKLYRILNDKAEIIEFLATSSFRALSVTLADIPTKKNLLVLAILRGNNVITPGGSDTIEIGDNVIVVSSETILEDLNDILE